MQQTLFLSFQHPEGEPRELELKTSASDAVLIGRNRASTIKLSMPSVSRQHARIFFEGGAYWIEDMGSSNGTFVNREQVHRARINAGDLLQCGEFALEVLSRGETSVGSGVGHAQAGGLSTAPSLPPFMETPPPEAPRARPSLPPQASRPPRASAPPPQSLSDAPRRAAHSSSPARAKDPYQPEPYDQDIPTAQSFPSGFVARGALQAPPALLAQEAADRWHSKAPTNTPTPMDERLAENLERARLELQRLKEREVSLGDQLRTRDEEVTTLRAQVEAHRALSEKQRHELKALEGARLSLSGQLESLERERAALEGVRGELEGARGELEGARAQLSELREALSAARAEADEARVALKAEQARAASVTQSAPRPEELEALGARVRELDAALGAERAALVEAREAASAAAKEASAAALELKAARQLSQRESEELLRSREERAALQARAERLEDELSAARAAERVTAEPSPPPRALPRPNEAATSPDWALHQARFTQLRQELRELRRPARPSHAPQAQQLSIPPASSDPRREGGEQGARPREWRGLV